MPFYSIHAESVLVSISTNNWPEESFRLTFGGIYLEGNILIGWFGVTNE